MNKMTRIFMTAVLAVVLFACGNNNETANTEADSTATTTTVDTVATAPATVDTAAAVPADTAAMKTDSAQ